MDGLVLVVLGWFCLGGIVLVVLSRWSWLDGFVLVVSSRWSCLGGLVFVVLSWWSCLHNLVLSLAYIYHLRYTCTHQWECHQSAIIMAVIMAIYCLFKFSVCMCVHLS